MRRIRRLLILALVLSFALITGCGKQAAPEPKDKGIVGLWQRVEGNKTYHFSFRPDGTLVADNGQEWIRVGNYGWNESQNRYDVTLFGQSSNTTMELELSSNVIRVFQDSEDKDYESLYRQ